MNGKTVSSEGFYSAGGSPPETAVVPLPDAGADNFAVVVERRHAPVALTAVMRSQRDLCKTVHVQCKPCVVKPQQPRFVSRAARNDPPLSHVTVLQPQPQPHPP